MDAVQKVHTQSFFYAYASVKQLASVKLHILVHGTDTSLMLATIILKIVQPRLRHSSDELHLGWSCDCHSWSCLAPHHDSI